MKKMRKNIGRKGKAKYLKYFNSTLVADFIFEENTRSSFKEKIFMEQKII